MAPDDSPTTTAPLFADQAKELYDALCTEYANVLSEWQNNELRQYAQLFQILSNNQSIQRLRTMNPEALDPKHLATVEHTSYERQLTNSGKKMTLSTFATQSFVGFNNHMRGYLLTPDSQTKFIEYMVKLCIQWEHVLSAYARGKESRIQQIASSIKREIDAIIRMPEQGGILSETSSSMKTLLSSAFKPLTSDPDFTLQDPDPSDITALAILLPDTQNTLSLPKVFYRLSLALYNKFTTMYEAFFELQGESHMYDTEIANLSNPGWWKKVIIDDAFNGNLNKFNEACNHIRDLSQKEVVRSMHPSLVTKILRLFSADRQEDPFKRNSIVIETSYSTGLLNKHIVGTVALWQTPEKKELQKILHSSKCAVETAIKLVIQSNPSIKAEQQKILLCMNTVADIDQNDTPQNFIQYIQQQTHPTLASAQNTYNITFPPEVDISTLMHCAHSYIFSKTHSDRLGNMTVALCFHPHFNPSRSSSIDETLMKAVTNIRKLVSQVFCKLKAIFDQLGGLRDLIGHLITEIQSAAPKNGAASAVINSLKRSSKDLLNLRDEMYTNDRIDMLTLPVTKLEECCRYSNDTMLLTALKGSQAPRRLASQLSSTISTLIMDAPTNIEPAFLQSLTALAQCTSEQINPICFAISQAAKKENDEKSKQKKVAMTASP